MTLILSVCARVWCVSCVYVPTVCSVVREVYRALIEVYSWVIFWQIQITRRGALRECVLLAKVVTVIRE